MIPETLTMIERQILSNQYRILSQIGDPTEDYETKIEILTNGYTEKYYEVFDVNTEEIPLEICEETTQIFYMYKRINETIKSLSEIEKSQLNLDAIKFEGFNARRNPHYHYFGFLVEKTNQWDEYTEMYFLSAEEQQLSKYKKMLEYQVFLLDNDQYSFRKEDLTHMINMVTSSAVVNPFQVAV